MRLPGQTELKISTEDARESLLPEFAARRNDVLGRFFGDGLNLLDLLEEVVCRCLTLDMEETGVNKTQAAELVGLTSYQILSNLLSNHG